MEKQKLKLIELFSGIGAQKRGIDMTGLFDCEVIATSEVNKEVMLSYAAVHNGLTLELVNLLKFPEKEIMVRELAEKNIGYDYKKNKPYNWEKLSRRKDSSIEKYYAAMKFSRNMGDITKIESLPESDMWTYSFPCQDISVAGAGKGIVQGKTRSGLLYEVERLLGVADKTGTKPRYLLLENVKNLVGKKFIDQFNDWVERLDSMGYNTYWKVVNGKECGVPQNRERVFAISILKEIDSGYMSFPKPIPLEIRLKDVLDQSVDEKYYLSDKAISGFVKHNENHTQKGTGFIWKPKDPEKEIANCLRANSSLNATDNSIRCIGNIYPNTKNSQAGRIYDDNGISPTLDVLSGGNKMPKIIVKESPIEVIIAASRGRNPDNPSDRTTGAPTEQRLELNQTGCSNTLTSVQKDNYVIEYNVLTPKRTEYGKAIRKDYELGKISESRHNMTQLEPRTDGVSNTLTTVQKDNYLCERYPEDVKIRKLTPEECWKLMGFMVEDVTKAKSIGVSESQLYCQAGNSIITNCIAEIMEHLYKAQYNTEYICSDEILNSQEEADNGITDGR